jgi:hypothetical protein
MALKFGFQQGEMIQKLNISQEMLPKLFDIKDFCMQYH